MISGKQTTAWAEVDEQGRLVIPADIVREYGLKPGARVRLECFPRASFIVPAPTDDCFLYTRYKLCTQP